MQNPRSAPILGHHPGLSDTRETGRHPKGRSCGHAVMCARDGALSPSRCTQLCVSPARRSSAETNRAARGAATTSSPLSSGYTTGGCPSEGRSCRRGAPRSAARPTKESSGGFLPVFLAFVFLPLPLQRVRGLPLRVFAIGSRCFRGFWCCFAHGCGGRAAAAQSARS